MNFKEHLLNFIDREEVEQILNSINFEPTHCFLLNSLKVNNIEDININNVKTHPHINNAFIYDKEKLELGKSILFEQGAYYIQEPAAMMAEFILDIKENDKVLDMCAAPGGKSFDASIHKLDRGLLVCNDLSQLRSKILSSNIEKYGFKNVIVLNDDSSNYKKKFYNFFDKIILDAPCSGSAMFRKNSEANDLWSYDKVLECSNIQEKLIEDAYDMLNGNGYLLYSTCSFSIEENENIIKSFLERHNDMELINIPYNALYNDSIGIHGGLRLYPYKFEGEGQTIFILKKNSEVVNLKINEYKSTRLPKEIEAFLKDINFKYDRNNIINFGTHYYLAEFPKINLDKIKVNRYGLELGEMVNDRFIPSHALAMYHGIDKSIFIDLNEKEAKDYLAGLTINKEGNSGFKIASYNNLALGWVKHVNNTLKNHYPKGLRKFL